MSLHHINYTPPTEQVAFRGGAFTVRGLSTDDLALLVHAHLESMEIVLAIVRDMQNGPVAGDPLARLMLLLAQEAPAMVSHIIAVAAGEPDAADIVRKFPFPVAVDALMKVGRLTFENVGGPENFFAALAVLRDGLAPAAKKPTSARPSSPSTGASAKT